MANFAAMPNDIQVHFLIGFRRENPGQMLMCGLDAHPLRAQPETAGHAVYVGIHRKVRFTQREQQHDGRSFRTDTFETQQVCPALVPWHVTQVFEVQAALLGCDLLQHLLDAGSFLVGQTRDPDGFDYPIGVGIAYGFPGWELFTERFESPIPVGIVCVLGKDGRDEFV